MPKAADDQISIPGLTQQDVFPSRNPLSEAQGNRQITFQIAFWISEARGNRQIYLGNGKLRLNTQNFIDKSSKSCLFSRPSLSTGGLNHVTTKLKCLLEKMAQIARRVHDVGNRVFYDETKVRAIAQLAALGGLSFDFIPLIFKEHNQAFYHHQTDIHPLSVSAQQLQNAVVLIRTLASTEAKSKSACVF
jgi:hypothetical protein